MSIGAFAPPSTAVDPNDRMLAFFAWGGIVAFGPVTPVVVLMLSSRQRDSLAYQHARLALVVWVVGLVVWLPVLVFGVLTRLNDPATPFVPIVAVVLVLATLGCSVWGVIAVGRTPIRQSMLPLPPPPAAPGNGARTPQ